MITGAVGRISRNPEARFEGRAGMVADRRPDVTGGHFFLRESTPFESRPWDLLPEAGPSSQGLERCL